MMLCVLSQTMFQDSSQLLHHNISNIPAFARFLQHSRFLAYPQFTQTPPLIHFLPSRSAKRLATSFSWTMDKQRCYIERQSWLQLIPIRAALSCPLPLRYHTARLHECQTTLIDGTLC